MPVDVPVATRPHSLGQSIHHLHKNWLWMVVFGAALVLAGLIGLGAVGFATLATVLMVGIMMLVCGAAELALGFRAKDWSHFFLWVLGGILYIAAGTFAIVNPILASLVLTLMLGAGLIAAGLVRIFLATQLPSGRHRGLVVVSGLITALLGLVIVLHWPTSSVFVLGMLLAIDLIVQGTGWIIFGSWLRNAHR